MASLNSARVKARDAKRKEDMHTLELVIQQYYHDNNGTWPSPTDCESTQGGDWPDLFKTALAPYISKLPTDSVANNITRYYAFCKVSWGPCSGQKPYLVYTFLEGSTPVDACLGAGWYSRPLGY